MAQPVQIDVYIDNLLLKQVEECKFLGVIIDSKLKWKSQISEINIKISKLIGVLHKIRNSLTTECLRQIYLSLIYPYFLYCSAVWEGTCSTYINSLFVTPKKLLRVMTCNHRFAHTDPLFKELKLLKLQDILYLQTCIFVHKAINSNRTEDNFQVTANRNSRKPNDLVLPLCRTSHAQRCITVRGVRHWNNLPEHIKTISSCKTFKNKIIQLFLK